MAQAAPTPVAARALVLASRAEAEAEAAAEAERRARDARRLGLLALALAAAAGCYVYTRRAAAAAAGVPPTRSRPPRGPRGPSAAVPWRPRRGPAAAAAAEEEAARAGLARAFALADQRTGRLRGAPRRLLRWPGMDIARTALTALAKLLTDQASAVAKKQGSETLSFLPWGIGGDIGAEVAKFAGGWLFAQLSGLLFPAPEPAEWALLWTRLDRIDKTLVAVRGDIQALRREMQDAFDEVKYELREAEVRAPFAALLVAYTLYESNLRRAKAGEAASATDVERFRVQDAGVGAALTQLAAVAARGDYFRLFRQVVEAPNAFRAKLLLQRELDRVVEHYAQFEAEQLRGVQMAVEMAHMPTPEERAVLGAPPGARAPDFEAKARAYFAGAEREARARFELYAGHPAGAPAVDASGAELGALTAEATGLFAQRARLGIPTQVEPRVSAFRYVVHRDANLMWALVGDAAVDRSATPVSAYGPTLEARARAAAAREHDGVGGWRLPTARELTYLLTSLHAGRGAPEDAAPYNFWQDGFAEAALVDTTNAGAPRTAYFPWPARDLGAFWGEACDFYYGVRGSAYYSSMSQAQHEALSPADRELLLPDAHRWAFLVDVSEDDPVARVGLYRSDLNAVLPYAWAALAPPAGDPRAEGREGDALRRRLAREMSRVRHTMLVRVFDEKAPPPALPRGEGDRELRDGRNVRDPAGRQYRIAGGRKAYYVRGPVAAPVFEVPRALLDATADAPPIYNGPGWHFAGAPCDA